MSHLLTTKQVQEILKVDRITIYRMINDGRIKGVKIGNHWRFHQHEIDRFIGRTKREGAVESVEEPLSEFPSGCVEKVEALVAGILGIGITTVNADGDLLNAFVHPNPFCQLMLASKSGARACAEDWRKPDGAAESPECFHTCHAGLCFLRSAIDLEGRTVAWVIAGQFALPGTPPADGESRLAELAGKHHIPLDSLRLASESTPVISPQQQAQVEEWSPQLAHTIQSILQERSDLTLRLQKISEISSLQPAFTEPEEKATPKGE
jgi:excisionase family DNA binding protein